MKIKSNNQTKVQARKVIRQRLEEMTHEDYQADARIVYDKIHDLLLERAAAGELHAVLSYHAVAKWREVDVLSLEDDLPGVRFDHVPLDADAPFPDMNYDVILVPLYGFNDEGYRLGHGRGWYDKFLAGQPGAQKIGIGLDASEISFSPEPHDVRLDLILTESRSAVYARIRS